MGKRTILFGRDSWRVTPSIFCVVLFVEPVNARGPRVFVTIILLEQRLSLTLSVKIGRIKWN